MSTTPRPHPATAWSALALILALAVGARVTGLGRQSLWTDEGLSVLFARGDLADTLEVVRRDFHPPLYFLILNLWLDAWGDSEVAIRSLSALGSVLAVLGLAVLGTRLGGPALGQVAALLGALSLYQIYYAQEARAYALVAAFTVWSMERYVAWRRRPGAGRLVGWVLATTLLLSCHYFGAFVPLVQGLDLLLRRPARAPGRIRELGLAVAGVALLLAPWLPSMRQQFDVVRSGFWMEQPGASDLAGILPALLVYRPAWFAAPWFVGGLAVLGMLLLAGRGLVTRVESRDGARLSWFLALWVLVPVLVGYALSQTEMRVFHRRSLMVVAPGLVLAVAWLALRAPQAWQRIALVALVGAWSVAGYGAYYGRVHKHNYRAAAAYVRGVAGPEDAIRHDPIYFSAAFDHYYRQPYAALPADAAATAAQVFCLTPRANESWRRPVAELQRQGYEVVERKQFRALTVVRLRRLP